MSKDARERYFDLRKVNPVLRELGKLFEGIEWEEEGPDYWSRHNMDTGYWLAVYGDDLTSPSGGVTIIFPDGKRQDFHFE